LGAAHVAICLQPFQHAAPSVCDDDWGIALNARRRRAVSLMPVDHSRTPRRLEQIRFGVRPAAAAPSIWWRSRL